MAVVVTYNGYGFNAIEKYTISQDEKNFSFSGQFLLLGTSEANLVGLSQTAEDKLSEKNGDFSIVFGGTTHINLDHSSNTGFLARPTIRKVDSPLATATSRVYAFTVNIQLPFDQSGYGFRREGHFTVSYMPSRQRVVNFSALYTAGGANTALDNYNAGIGSWTSGILTDLGGNYEKISEQFDQEQEDKILNAKLTFKEIISDQDGSGPNNAKIVDSTCNYSVMYSQEAGFSEENLQYNHLPPVNVSVQYSCNIDFEEEPTDTDIEGVYEITVKPFILGKMSSILGLSRSVNAGSTFIVQNERKTVNPHNYVVNGSMVLTALRSQTQIIEYSERITLTTDEGITHRKIWDGQLDTHAIWSIGGNTMVQRTTTITQMGNEPSEPNFYAGASSGSTGNNWIRLSIMKNREVVQMGKGAIDPVSQSLFAYTVIWMETYLRVNPITSTVVFSGL